VLFRTADPTHEAQRATRLLAVSKSVLTGWGTRFQPYSQTSFHQYVATAREQLGEEAFAIAWEEGSVMSLDEAVTYALGESDEF
jgi:hypothetical protein